MNKKNVLSFLIDKFTASRTVPVAPLLDEIAQIWTIFDDERYRQSTAVGTLGIIFLRDFYL